MNAHAANSVEVEPIYMDGFATTPMRPQARLAMIKAMDLFGNPNSGHKEGRVAQQTVEHGLRQVSTLIGSTPNELVLTSGATEANELALSLISSQARQKRDGRTRIVISAIEHDAVVRASNRCVVDGLDVVICPISEDGSLCLKSLRALVDETTLLVSVMMASNLTGGVQPIAQAVEIAHAAGAFFHTDAAQAVGKIPVDVFELNIDLMTLSAHKFGGPKGVGALYVASSADFAFGEFGETAQSLRQGTPSALLIAGFGAAAEISAVTMEGGATISERLLEVFCACLAERGIQADRIGDKERTVPGTAGLVLRGYDTDELVARLGGKICLSNASACHGGQLRASPLLAAMHIDEDVHCSFLRVSLGWWLDEGQVRAAATLIWQVGSHNDLATGEFHQ